jgi:rhodanese-related sulfurtransferase
MQRSSVVNNVLLALTAVSVTLFSGPAFPHDVNIYQAVIGEPDQKTQEISTEEMRKVVSQGGATVVDTRPRAEFVNGHIPGSNNLSGPPSDVVAEVEKLVGGDKSKALVLYCNGPFCQASRRTSAQLLDAGFTNVRRYQLGMPIWRALGGPTEIDLEGVVRIFKNDQTAVMRDRLMNSAKGACHVRIISQPRKPRPFRAFPCPSTTLTRGSCCSVGMLSRRVSSLTL